MDFITDIEEFTLNLRSTSNYVADKKDINQTKIKIKTEDKTKYNNNKSVFANWDKPNNNNNRNTIIDEYERPCMLLTVLLFCLGCCLSVVWGVVVCIVV